MSAQHHPPRKIGNLLTSLFFVAVGFVTLYDAQSYTDRDSQVFPQAVAIMMIIAAGIACVMWLVRPSGRGGFGEGIWWRRILLIATMLASGLAMPYIGFLPAGGIAFAGGLIAAMHDEWSGRLAVIYIAVGAVVMVAFYALFKYALYVPLP